jgi:hypothetical protein
MLLYGMDGDPSWNNRHTRFLAEIYAGVTIKLLQKVQLLK